MSFCIFDAHADTISEILDKNEDILKNNCHIDLTRIKKLKRPYIQVFAAFTKRIENPSLRVLKIIDKYYEFVKRNDLIHCENFSDIESSIKSDKILSLLSIEGGDALLGSLEMLRIYYRLGVRIITLTWNYSNEIASGIMDKSDTGLTCFGRTVVEEMNKLGMIIDVSHLSEKSFWDVAESSSMPFIASHSNARSICAHPRNLTDEQIKKIISKNGVIGLNFYADFLSNDEKCSISDIIRHLEHILSLGGENSIGFGSDFDGMKKLPDGVFGVESYNDIISKLLKLGYSEELIRKICCDNFLRVVKEVL